MKQYGGGIRLVQRKFAQGVPIPSGVSAPPPPPERKPEPPKEDLTVYHSRMSARSLLDVVALQNVHRHKQPMVLLERLRVDEIPSPTPPVTAKKKLKSKNNRMCLRPREKPAINKYTRKRKAKEPIKVPARKRVCKGRPETSSTTEDDMPLLYFSNNTILRPKTNESAKAAAVKDELFTFKRPSKAVILKYRTFQRTTRTRVSTALASGRAPANVLTPRRQTRRSLRCLGAAEPVRVMKRAARKLPVSAEPRTRQRVSTTSSISTVVSYTSSEWLPNKPKKPKPAARPKATNLSAGENKVVVSEVDMSTVQEQPPSGTSESLPMPVVLPEIIDLSADEDRVDIDTANMSPVHEPQPSVSAEPRTRQRASTTSSISTIVSYAPSELLARPYTATEVESLERTDAPSPCPSASYNSVQEVVVATTSNSSSLQRRCKRCRICLIVDKIIQLTRLVNPVCRNPGAVYDFNNELDEAIYPSLACLRNRRRLTTSEEESHLFLDLLPPHSPHIIQIICKRTAARQFMSAACIVNRDVMTATRQPSLIEHENLLDQLLECMGRRAEARAGPGAHEPAPSTSRGAPAADGPDAADSAPVLGTRSAGREQPAADASDVDERESTIDDFRPIDLSSGKVLEAPVFYPTEDEFMDPIEYYKKIEPLASKYGLCKIVAPAGFRPPCNMSDHIRFAVIYQYISKLYSRWGPVSRELAAIKAHLRTQSVVFARSPLLDGSEVNLPKLYHSVQRNGGPTKVIQRKRWGRVAEEMKLTKLQNPERKLDQIYMRYLLPYATLSNQERQEKMADVEKCWTQKYQKMLYRARNPFHRQKRLLGEAESSEDEGEDGDTVGALHEAEDCIVQGRTMNLATFKKIATSLMEAHFDGASEPRAEAVEKAYWRTVLLGTDHIVANTASIDTGEEGYGFPKDPDAEYGPHPWNLKMLTKNPKNVLRFLGPVLGVTVPTLHLSMLFSTSCWHRDPHGLPWTEYMHHGAEKVWYGIPSEQSANFRRAVETLCPAYCQNKSIWLASDIAMIPPEILSEHDVTLSRLTQRPGEYVMVFPEAHTCSITTGYCISESVYFATDSWLESVFKLFQELRNSCEPTMFSLEQLLMNGGDDENAPRRMLLPICSVLGTLVSAEVEHRRVLELKGVKVRVTPAVEPQVRAWNARDQDECEFCRCTLFLSKVTGLAGRKSSVCAEHAIRLLDIKKYRNVDVKSLDFLSSFSTTMLEEMLEKLEKRISE